MADYYTYAFLRDDHTPYYIGKGKLNRAYKKRGGGVNRPRNKDKIVILKSSLTEAEAHKHEVYMISVLGRKDIGTGILRNRTDGGEGTSGRLVSEETKRKMSQSSLGNSPSPETRDKIAESVKGFNWYNDGITNIQCKTDPGVGWVKGRVLRWETPRNSGMKWFNKDGKNKMFNEDPGEGWKSGMLPKSKINNQTNKGKKWFNDGTTNRMFTEAPEGWGLGMLRKTND